MRRLLAWIKAHPEGAGGILAGVLLLVALLVGVNAFRRPSFSDVQSSHSVLMTQTVEVERVVVKTETKYRDRYVKKYDPQTGHLTYESGLTSGSTSGSRDESHSTARTETSVVDTTRVVTRTEGRWSVRAGAGLSSGGTVLGTVGADYRLVGPFTIGAQVLVPVSGPGQFSGLLTLGLRL